VYIIKADESERASQMLADFGIYYVKLNLRIHTPTTRASASLCALHNSAPSEIGSGFVITSSTRRAINSDSPARDHLKKGSAMSFRDPENVN
jgi:hypothetical protein